VYLNPRPKPEELAAYYPSDYMPFLPAIEDEPHWFRRLDRRVGLRRRVRLLRRWHGGRAAGALLDVGCATGVFLDGMRAEGWRVQGVEPSEHAARYARDRFGLDVYQGSLEAAGFPPASFDVVTLWDVLEHVFSPTATLREIARILKPNGSLVFSVPDLDCVEARVFGRYWAGLDMPRHLNLFTHKVLTRLLAEAGFRVTARSHFTGRFGVLALSIRFWADERLRPDWLRRGVVGLATSLPARMAAMPYYAIADRLHQSSIVTLQAVRAL
jgi:SAM-dependent methyltransferase